MNKNNILEQYRRMATNFITPKIIEYTMTPDYRIIELSQGEDMQGDQIFGVTELAIVNGRLQTTKHGQMHHSKLSARKHFNVLLGAF